MAEQLARGLFANFAANEPPFDVPNGMEDNLRRIDDHLGLYTLQPPVAPGTPLPAAPVNGAGQIYTDGSYAVFNAGSWALYPARKGIFAQMSDSSDAWLNSGSGWSSGRVLNLTAAEIAVPPPEVLARRAATFLSPSGRRYHTNDAGTALLVVDMSLCLETSVTQSPAFNLTTINNRLALGGVVRLAATTAAAIEINGPLVIDDNTTLVVDNKTRLKQTSGVSGNMLVTKAYQTAATPVTLAWAAGTAVTVTWAGHGRSVGDYVCIDNTASATTNDSKFKGVYRVASVPDVNTFTYNTERTPKAAPTGTWFARKATTNAKVFGGIWDYNAATNPSVTEKGTIAMMVAFSAKCEVRPHRFENLLKFGVCLAMDRESIAGNLECNGTNETGGDAVKVYGPAYYTQVENVTGRTADDMVSVQTKEPPIYAAYAASFGDCLGVKVRNTSGGKNGNSTAAVVLYASANETHSGCEIDGVHGVFAGQCVRVQPGDGLAATLLDAKIRNVGANGTNQILIGGGGGAATLRYGKIAIDGVVHNPVAAASDSITVGGNATGNVLTIDGFVSEVDSLTTPTWPTGSAAVCIHVYGAVNLLNIDGAEMNATGNARFVQLANASAVRTLNISKTRLQGDQGVAILATPGVVPQINFEGCDLALTYGVNATAAANITAKGCTLNGATVLARQTAGTVNLAHGGNTLNGTSTLTAGAVTATAW